MNIPIGTLILLKTWFNGWKGFRMVMMLLLENQIFGQHKILDIGIWKLVSCMYSRRGDILATIFFLPLHIAR